MSHVNPIQIQKFLKGVDYPASKSDLIDNARSMGADESVCESLARLPDQQYETPVDVSHAFGELPDEVETGGSQGREAREAPAPRGESGRQSPHTGGNEFLIEAIQDSMAEIQICEMALEKSQNPDVLAFAQSMIDEHGRMGRELEELASNKRLDTPRQLRREQQMTADELAGIDGRDFEQRWIQYNIDVHERDVKVFRHYAEDDSDREIQELARRHVDEMGKHLKQAHDVGKKLAKARH